MGFFSSEEIIKIIKNKIGLKEENYQLHRIWEKVSGKSAKHTQVVKVKQGKMWITVESPVYLQELIFKKRELIKEINKHIGKEDIKEIKFTIKNI